MTADFGAQANALLRKSAVYQKRNVKTNICLISSPIFFCIILALIKVVIDKVFLTGIQFECGCKCTECCDKTGVCTSLQQGYCVEDLGYTCKKYDKSQCGLAFSSPQQASWCEVFEPSSWPPMYEVPKQAYRAQKPDITAFITAPDPPSFNASELRQYILSPPPVMNNETLLALLPQLVTENGTVNAHLLAKYGYTFGTTGGGGRSQYIDIAFADNGQESMYLLVPKMNTTSCALYAKAWAAQYGAGNSSTDKDPAMPLIALLGGLVMMTSNTTITANQVTGVLGQRPILAGFLYRKTKCANMTFIPIANTNEMNQLHRCGYKQSICEGKAGIIEYANGFEYGAASLANFSIALHYNGTDAAENDNQPDIVLRLNAGLSGSVVAWATRMLGGNGTLSRGARFLGTMAMPKKISKLKLDFSNFLGPLFYTWVVQELLPIFMQLLVYEKEKRLRMMMKMHGLGDAAYWLVTYLWFLLLYIVYIIVFIIFGAAVGLELFRRTNMGVQVVFYFLFGNNLIAMAFMLSSFFSSSRTATVVSFIYVFATGLIGELLLKVFMEQDAAWIFFLEWIPAFSLYRGLWEMAEYTFLGVYRDERGLTFARLSDPGNGMRATWAIFVVEWVIFMVLGWYFEQVLSNGTGIRRSPFFFLECCCPRRKPLHTASPRTSVELTADAHAARGTLGSGNGIGSGSFQMSAGEREDVRAERLRVEALDAATAQDTPIVVRDLRKVYPPLDGNKPKLAVRTLTVAIERGECFGLLGPNGAGKSTSINMLTGFLEPSSGSAVIEGHDIQENMAKVYRLMGVCPQHDLLWEQLTGEEHLLFYGRLKGLTGAALNNAVAAGLKSVNLLNGGVGQKQSQKYSGGMRRRLSVAISFIGDPKVVYLDEPSTGLDPASRRNLWDVVRNNKDGRAIILTTHSMEEAEILCDRLGIFVDGQLVCIGNPREITSRYAGYLVFTITVGPGHEDAARAFVTKMSPNARLTYALGSTFKYELPTTDVSLSGVFDAMASAKSTMSVLDWGVANATLEEVFIKFAREIGAETKEG